MNPLGLLRGAGAALVTYAVVLVVALLPAGAFDPLEQSDGLAIAVVIAYFVAALAGGFVGTWQARAGGVTAPALGVLAAVVPLVLVGTALVAGEGTAGVSDPVFYGVNPVGAIVGAALYARRWLAGVR